MFNPLPPLGVYYYLPPFYKSLGRDTLRNLLPNHPRVTRVSGFGPFREAEDIIRWETKMNFGILQEELLKYHH